MLDLFTQSAPVFIAVVFAFALVIGSFLNVVIHRLPIMMEREWREQCQELCETPPETELPKGRFDLIVPRSRWKARCIGSSSIRTSSRSMS